MRSLTASKKEIMTTFDAEVSWTFVVRIKESAVPDTVNQNNFMFTANGNLVPRDQINSLNLDFTVH